QCWLTWSRQLNSDLAQDFRLVAMDLRGHGLSDKPQQGYDDTKLWADDVNAVIATLSLANPVLCGWSYGSLVVLDYIRHYGEGKLGGVHVVDGVTKLGSQAALAVLGAEFLALIPGFFSTDAKEGVASLEALIRLCVVREPAPEELYLMLGFNASVPPYVRQALFSRTVDNDDILPTIRKPFLITHGSADAIVKPMAADQHKASLPHAEIHMMDNVGHAPFWDDAATFNQRQRAFCATLSK
ncbi:MAG TPA: alpha/beta hydrolase, partial [Candidatus Eisenbacteria bacterium]|nr:alpha/beta hydrolase [Candidatus Eisenbacteria bacterium]